MEDVRLIHGDSLDVLRTLESGSVDAVVTDPPYGIAFRGKAGASRNQRNFRKHETYTSYEDTEENWFAKILPAIKHCIESYRTAAFFTASQRLFDMPRGGEVGGIFQPSGTGLSRWGFQCFMHVCFYGKCPYQMKGKGRRPNGKYGIYGNDSNKIAHPCAKPLAAMKWLIERTTLPGETVLDPFMGSGTTGVACMQTGRRFIGIEIDKGYFDIAQKRIAEAQNAMPLFQQPKQTQQLFLLEK